MTHLAFPFNRRFAEFILQKIPNLFMACHGHRTGRDATGENENNFAY